MKIVIDIPDRIYKRKGYLNIIDSDILREALRNGTPLPKGYGRLIDADKLKMAYDERITYLYTLNKKDNPSRETKICATNWCNNTIDELPTIIEADKDGD